MSPVPHHLKPDVSPIADSKAMVLLRDARFTVITPRLIRMEFSPTGAFEDRASLTFWRRKQRAPSFSVTKTSRRVVVTTSHLKLTYQMTGAGFTPSTLSVKLRKPGTTWRFGDENHGNLGGTCRTLDGCNGATKIPDGLMSRDGWSVVDDSDTMAFNAAGWPVQRRPAGDGGDSRSNADVAQSDLYFFGYGADYQACLTDFFRVSGPTPLIPRWMLGNWWSRYWAYSQDDLVRLIDGFRANEIPLSVCIIDMDWHIVKNKHTNGWTGYTWNKEYFPDPEGFLKWLHDQGLRTALNLHPADGVHPHEKAYPAMAKAMGIDPKSGKPIPFDLADPAFVNAYFEQLHHPLEKQGIDFWWMDWQQGTIKGIDPLFILNHLHSLDMARDGVRRPVAFSRWGGLGSHRYPIGFSGDTSVTWESLAFQPFFTATAANVGYYLWSHDIGGHHQGMEDDELLSRWVQFGTFSPILRIHSSNGKFQDRRPWVKDGESANVIRQFMQLRQKLQPYVYTMVRKGTEESIPLVKPMYWDHSEDERAYAAQNQYYFGSELLVAPFISPIDPNTRLSRAVVWLPKGDWYNIFSGEYFPGDRFTAVYGELEEMPVFARAGAIVPQNSRCDWGDLGNPVDMTVNLFAGADGDFSLYEDDGSTVAYRAGGHCTTRIRQRLSDKALTVTIDAPQGDPTVIPARRQWRIVVFGVKQQTRIRVTVGSSGRGPETSYDPERDCLTVLVGTIPSTEKIKIVLDAGKGSLLARRNRRDEKLFRMLFTFRLATRLKNVVSGTLDAMRTDPDAVDSLVGLLTDSQGQALAETLYDAGGEWFHANADTGKNCVVVWNNSGAKCMRYHFTSRWGSIRAKGVIPRCSVVGFQRRETEDRNQLWPGEGWTLGVNYAGIAKVSLDSGH